MLFGSIELQNDVLQQAKEYADLHDMTLVYGAMVGSISKGLQYADSDYDTRFLFLRKDFPEKICIPSEMKETELVKRYYPEGKVYEWIPFWELTSFLQFLDKPSFLNDFSVGLYNIVGWTFMSPYIWDPYGLQSKLMPLINMAFNEKYEIKYHKGIIEKYIPEFGRSKVISKSYLNALHAAATIEWSMIFHTSPPIDLQTLLYGLKKEEIWKDASKIVNESRAEARNNLHSVNSQLHDSHFTVMTFYSETLENYVMSIYNSIKEDQVLEIEVQSQDTTKDCINDMYKIISNSVYACEQLIL